MFSPAENAALFFLLNFPYVCPEPVLVKRSYQKKGFSLRTDAGVLPRVLVRREGPSVLPSIIRERKNTHRLLVSIFHVSCLVL